MKKKNILFIILGFIIVGALSVRFIFIKNEKQEFNLETITVKLADISTEVTATGTVEPIKKVEVGTQVSGVIEKIYVDYNSVVKEGQLIAELDKTNLKNSLKDAQANYDKALNEKDYLQGIYERQKILFEKELISLADYEVAKYNYQNSLASVTQRQSDLEKAKTNLGYADIYSPIDGVVLERAVDEGQTVAASLNTPTLFTIAKDLSEMQVEADVDEADIGEVKEGQRISFLVDAFPDEVFSGTITQVRLNPTVSSSVVTYTVVARAENPEKKLMPGLTATISIYTEEVYHIPSLKIRAFNFKPDFEMIRLYNSQKKDDNPPAQDERKPLEHKHDSTRVLVWVLQNGMIRPVPVKTGVNDGVTVQITEGLEPGQEVICAMDAGEKQLTEKKNSGEESPFMPKPPGRRKK